MWSWQSRSSVVAALLLPFPRTVAVVAVGACLAGWAWGTVRLDALDRSPLLADVDRGGRALLEITGEARTGAFELRIPARIHRFEGTAGRRTRPARAAARPRAAAGRTGRRPRRRAAAARAVARLRRAALAAPAGSARRPQGRRLAHRRSPRRARRPRRPAARLAATRRRARFDGAAARRDRRRRAG